MSKLSKRGLLLLLFILCALLALYLQDRWISIGDLPEFLTSFVEEFLPAKQEEILESKPKPVLSESPKIFRSHGEDFFCTSSNLPEVNASTPDQVYRWTDDAGRVHFGDEPPGNVTPEVVDLDQQSLEYFALSVSYPSGYVPADIRTAVEVGGTAIYKIYSDYLSLPKMVKSNISVKVFGNAAQYQKYRAQVAPDVPASTDGYYTWSRNEAVVLHRKSVDATRETALHEATHVINARNFGKMPKWFNEGTGEYFENLKISGQLTTLEFAREWVSGLGDEYQILSLERLLTAPREDWEGALNATFYANSWSLVYFLMLPENRPLIVKFLTELAQDKCDDIDSVAFFQREYFGGVAKLEQDWQRWLKGPHAFPTRY